MTQNRLAQMCTARLFLTSIILSITVAEKYNRDQRRAYLQQLGSPKVRSSLRQLRQSIYDKEENLEEQLERPRGSDIWRNKVKEFLSSRLESKVVFDEEVEHKEEDEQKNEEEDESNQHVLPIFLAPPGDSVMNGETLWEDSFEEVVTKKEDVNNQDDIVEITEKEMIVEESKDNEEDNMDDRETEPSQDETSPSSSLSTTAEIKSYEDDESTEKYFGFKTTFSDLQNFSEVVNSSLSPPVAECQTAFDCKSNQVCYLPTNECKDQLTLSLSQRNGCTQASHCNSNEVCYLATQACVCDLGYTEQAGSCISLQSIPCYTTLSNTSQIIDSSNWGIHPYCQAWGTLASTGKKLSFGTFLSGTGLDEAPMKFRDGSKYSCSNNRSAEMQYSCYCDEYSCDPEPSWDVLSLWWGEFDPCEYTGYVFTPLACSSKVA